MTVRSVTDIGLSHFLFGLIIFLFISVPKDIFSQEYYFDKYSVAEGLSSSKVYCILQGAKDFIWLGTPAGVSKFDGSNFLNYSPEEGLSAGGVKSIFEDAYHNVWFGHLDGSLSLFNGTSFKSVTLDSIKITGDITSIREAGDSSLWISTVGSGLIKISYNTSTGDILSEKQYRGSEGLSDRVFSTLKAHDGSFYCVAPEGIYKYVGKRDKFAVAIFPGLTTYFAKTTMFEDSHGNMWFGTYNGGLYKYDIKRDTTIIFGKRIGLAGNFISFITEDSKSNIWVGTIKYHHGESGLTKISGDKLKTYTIRNGLPDDEISFLIEDKESNLLIGTRNQGLCIFKGEQFVNIVKSDNFEYPKTYAIYQHRPDEYWFGTDKGIVRFFPERNEDSRFSYFNSVKNSIPEKIRFIKPDNRGTVWIGTEEAGVMEYRSAEKRFVYDSYLNRNLPSNGMVKALEVDSGNIWIGTSDGVAFWNPIEQTGVRYTQANGISGNFISSLFVDRRRNLWIGSEQAGKGLTRYNILKDKFKIINVGVEITPTAIVEDNSGNIWIGTSSRGVFALKDDSVFLQLTEESGLLSNVIKLLSVDDSSHIYIGTNRGLNVYKPHNNKVFAYAKKNGFVGIETQNNAVWHDDDRFWFGTAMGVTMMNLQKTETESIEPLTHIRSMLVNYKHREMVDIMELSYKENSIAFDYYSICLTNSDAVEYQVMLQGADEIWQPITKQTMAIYSALPPNKYIFKVKACNSYGKWNDNPVIFSFTILPPLYMRWWFILLIVIIFIIGFYIYVLVRERTLKRENRILEEKVADRTAEVVSKSKELEQRNMDITASIRYAKRIQNAILPPDSLFPNSFILFKPKDIVSGDFYWFYNNESKGFITAVDCTGHGVPGAFMSIIGHNSLNKIVKELGCVKPSVILDYLNEEVVNTLQNQSDDDDVKDGMDLAMIVYDKDTNYLEYAGAHNPLYLIRDGELIETKADRFAIGKTSLESGNKFTNNSIEIKSGDIAYIFSDGYADQFGGPKGKKFKIGALKKLFVQVSNMSMSEQKIYLNKTITEWMGEEEQVDDILIIGVKF